jgi:adenylate kinase family enzyme
MTTEQKYKVPTNHAILILCGIPGAGKTTLAHRIIEFHKNIRSGHSELVGFFQNMVNVHHICYDAVYEELMMKKMQSPSLSKTLMDFDVSIWHQSRKEAFQRTIEALTTENKKFNVQHFQNKTKKRTELNSDIIFEMIKQADYD